MLINEVVRDESRNRMVTLDALVGKEIVVYGTGANAVKCVSLLECRGIKIKYILDSREGIGRFKNYPVYMLMDEYLRGKYIIIACDEKRYGEIKVKFGKCREFKDYIHYSWLDKKMVFLYGNCHMDVIEAYLRSSGKFKERHTIYPAPRICMKQPVDPEVLAVMDIWVHEDIRKDNQFGYEFSDEYIRKFMVKDIVEIVIPHLYGLGGGFFPHAYQWNDKNTALLNGVDIGGMFPRRDDLIERCIGQDMDVEQICEYACEDGIIPEEYVLENFNNYIDKIREREKSWDIKILDFILEHYKHEKLFFDPGHPTNIILEKISKDILLLLGVSDDVCTDIKLDGKEIPVYPWIGKALGLEWSETFIRASEGAIKCRDEMDIAEYVREYVWWCYPERVKRIE